MGMSVVDGMFDILYELVSELAQKFQRRSRWMVQIRSTRTARKDYSCRRLELGGSIAPSYAGAKDMDSNTFVGCI